MEDTRIKKFRYRSWHRGCKETDVIMGKFCDKYISTLNSSELDDFEELIDEEDVDIWAWLSKKEASPEKYNGFIKKMQSLNEKI